MSTIALVCPDSGWINGASIILGTNSSIFQVLAQYCKQQVGPDYQQGLKMHALCSEVYGRWEHRGNWAPPKVLGALHFSRVQPQWVPVQGQWVLSIVCKWVRGEERSKLVVVETPTRGESSGALEVTDGAIEMKGVDQEIVTMIVVNPTMKDIIVHHR